MSYVKLNQDYAGYCKGNVFKIVRSRAFWGRDINSGPGWLSDGMWIGPFPATMPPDPLARYCITEAGYRENSHRFDGIVSAP